MAHITGIIGGNRATDTDKRIGARIREQRIISGQNQQGLAEAIGITYQQLHKYERGVNRISAGRLHDLAKALGVPVSVFFEGLDDGAPKVPSRRQRMRLELMQHFNSMADQQQDAVARITRAIADIRGS